jgi:hypothetical protein
MNIWYIIRRVYKIQHRQDLTLNSKMANAKCTIVDKWFTEYELYKIYW